ncbi:alkaline phosphatase D family protein [candidate division KSB1 bacterium]|nr:alkaline phosphatase D family protein [candidate division KSB1 bacterium]
MKKLFLFYGIIFLLSGCNKNNSRFNPYFGNGFRNGWIDQNSAVIWTRLTKVPELKRDGLPFIPLSNEEHQSLSTCTDESKIYRAQIPQGLTLEDMEGACPGTAGQVKLVYYPQNKRGDKTEYKWLTVDTEKNFTRQWKLYNLQAGCRYNVEIYARKDKRSCVSDTISGFFTTPPEESTVQEVTFCFVTCHDYNRRDDGINGHKIYPAMLKNHPDFYVHTGDVEYYDKPNPFCMTESLMFFKWNRIFALPFQRDFYTKVTTYFLKDDHDVLKDDAFPGTSYGNVSYERGLEIFDKIQFPSSDDTYNTIRWGKDLQIWLMDGRRFRSNNTIPDGPEKTIWGKVQKQWLFRTIKESDASFKLIISPTPILGPDRDNKNDNHSNQGFKNEGDEIRRFVNEQKNVYFCNGDRHWQYVTHWEGTRLWEFSCGAGSDEHAEGWSQEDKRLEHRFLRVKGGYLLGHVYRQDGTATLKFQHCDVDGGVVYEKLLVTE